VKKILIVDDDRDILELMAYILGEEDYQTLTLDNGDAILEEISRFKPDLILMDVMLEHLDGRDICHLIKRMEATRSLPVILVSASHDLSESLGREGAPDDFLSKPFELETLLHKVRSTLQKRQVTS
jgi:DNA-binding response OmpR family regulator